MGGTAAKQIRFSKQASKPTTPDTGEIGLYFAEEGMFIQDDGGLPTPIMTTGTSITDVTYAELMTAISNSSLTAGAWYRIINYATVHYMTSATGLLKDANNDSIINTGETEPLIVMALAPNKIHHRAYSASFPNDVIYYNPVNTDYAADTSFNIQPAYKALTIYISGTTGTAEITGAGGLTATLTFSDSVYQTISNFYNTYYEAYSEQGIYLEYGSSEIYMYGDYGIPFTDPVFTNLTGDLSAEINKYGDAAVGGYVPNLKGVIYFRHDTVHDNSAPYDFRTVKFRRWEPDFPAWDSAISYGIGDRAIYEGYIFLSLSSSNQGNTPSEGSLYWLPTQYADMPTIFVNDPLVADHQDLLTFSVWSGGGDTYENSFFNNHLYYSGTGSRLTNNVIYGSANRYSETGYEPSTYNNNFGCSMYNTFCGESITNSKIDMLIYSQIGTMSSCTLNGECAGLEIQYATRTVFNSSQGLIIGQIKESVVGANSRSIIAGSITGCTFTPGFSGCVWSTDSTLYNIIFENAQGAILLLDGMPSMSQKTTRRVFCDNDSVTRLSYYDTLNGMTYLTVPYSYVSFPPLYYMFMQYSGPIIH